MGGNDPVRDCQAEPGAATSAACCIEGLENVRKIVLVDTHTIVDNGYSHLFLWLQQLRLDGESTAPVRKRDWQALVITFIMDCSIC